jgi:excisionase family DNA binding protein
VASLVAARKDNMLTLSEAARLARVSPRTVTNWVRRGLPVMREGRVVRVDRQELLAWLARHRKERA